VDNNYFIPVRRQHLESYNGWRCSVQAHIADPKGKIWLGTRLWWDTGNLSDGRPMELLESYDYGLQDLAAQSNKMRTAHNAQFGYSFADITWISDQLGVIFSTDKDVQFALSAPFMGLDWDVQAKTVGVPKKKHLKYQGAIAEFNTKSSTSLLSQTLTQHHKRMTSTDPYAGERGAGTCQIKPKDEVRAVPKSLSQ
jgi:hypothetical protein